MPTQAHTDTHTHTHTARVATAVLRRGWPCPVLPGAGAGHTGNRSSLTVLSRFRNSAVWPKWIQRKHGFWWKFSKAREKCSCLKPWLTQTAARGALPGPRPAGIHTSRPSQWVLGRQEGTMGLLMSVDPARETPARLSFLQPPPCTSQHPRTGFPHGPLSTRCRRLR